MEYFVCKYTDKGGRTNNEDYVGITENVFVLADGLGGFAKGEVASRMAVEYIINNTYEIKSIDNDALHDVINKVNRKIYDNRIDNMATTIVVAYIFNGYFNYFNVGDSRLYYFRNSKIIIQSKDHSITQLCVDMGEIKPEQMRFHPDRNVLTKALGLKSDIHIPQKFEPIEIRCNDAFLLCSDGFWEYINEKEMIKCLEKSDTPQQWIDKMLTIVNKHIGPGNDNMSAIGVFIR